MMKEYPILMQADMVRALLNTVPNIYPPQPIDPSKPCKGQTRRPWRYQPLDVLPMNVPNEWVTLDTRNPNHGRVARCRFGVPGDRLWVKETWRHWHVRNPDDELAYRADFWQGSDPGFWKPSIHMPRSASRLTLELTYVKVQRIQEIDEVDAKMEGFVGDWGAGCIGAFRSAWDAVYSKRKMGWDANPYVWVLSFMRVED